MAYYEICNLVQSKGWQVVQDPTGSHGPYAFKDDQWVSFDDVATIRKKAEFVRNMKLGGAMIWALDLDDFKLVDLIFNFSTQHLNVLGICVETVNIHFSQQSMTTLHRITPHQKLTALFRIIICVREC